MIGEFNPTNNLTKIYYDVLLNRYYFIITIFYMSH
jgi:hypothetical protein